MHQKEFDSGLKNKIFFCFKGVNSGPGKWEIRGPLQTLKHCERDYRITFWPRTYAGVSLLLPYTATDLTQC